MSSSHIDDFDDFNAEMVQFWDISVFWRSFDQMDSSLYSHHQPRSQAQFREQVLASARVKWCIEHIIQKENLQSASEIDKKRVALYGQADEMYDEIAATPAGFGPRFMTYVTTKVIRKLFRHVYVRKTNFGAIKTALKQHPVVLVPTHRSYFDFLLVGIVLLCNHLPLPHMAGAIDFKDMVFFATMARQCGGFFLRRSNLQDDLLYHSIFTEYLQASLVNGDRPLKVFIEGTRSRANKSLYPKRGLLTNSVESFIRGLSYDVEFVPVSISFERIVEQNLYVGELLGTPKPKESFSGVLKARQVLSQDYGDVFINFGTPVSSRAFISAFCDRSIHALEPAWTFHMTQTEQRAVHNFANVLVNRQQHLQTVPLFSIVSTLLLTSSSSQNMTSPLTLSDLTVSVNWLSKIFSAVLNFTSLTFDPDDVTGRHVEECVLLHLDLCTIRSDTNRSVEIANRKADHRAQAATYLGLSLYRNHSIFVIYPVVLLGFIKQSCKNFTSDIYSIYARLLSIFSHEFVGYQEGSEILYESSTSLWQQHDSFLSNHRVKPFCSQLLQPFVIAYATFYTFLARNSAILSTSDPELVKTFRDKIFSAFSKLFREENPISSVYFEMTSSELMKNALAALRSTQILSNGNKNLPHLDIKKLDEIVLFLMQTLPLDIQNNVVAIVSTSNESKL